MKNLYYRLNDIGRPFWLLWVGESISMFGTQLVQFALSVWIYQKTGSALSFAGAIVASILPSVLVMPIAGAVVDKINRLHVMIVADSLAAIISFSLLALLWADGLEVYHLYIFTAFASFLAAFQGPAYQVSVAEMVRKDHLTRATGAMGVSSTSLGIIAPTLAGSLLVVIGLPGMVLLDLITFIAGTLFVWRAFSISQMKKNKTSFKDLWLVIKSSLDNFTGSFGFFERDPKMLTLFIYSLIQAAMIAMAVSMVIPLILSLHSAKTLGLVLSFAAVGALIGSLLMVLFDAPQRRMAVILGCDAVFALCIFFAGIVTSVTAFCVLEFIAGVVGSIASSCGYALWMSRVPENKRGSVMVLLGTCAMLSTAFMVVLGSVTVETILQPALVAGGALADSIGAFIGTGEGRGMALMFVICGVAGLVAALGGISIKSLRELR